MLPSQLKKLAESYTQISEGMKSEKEVMDWNKKDDNPEGKKVDKKKLDKCTSESYYLKRLGAMNPEMAERYLAIAEVLISEGYESHVLIDNIVEALPREIVGHDFRASLEAVNSRIYENLNTVQKRQARFIASNLSEDVRNLLPSWMGGKTQQEKDLDKRSKELAATSKREKEQTSKGQAFQTPGGVRYTRPTKNTTRPEGQRATLGGKPVSWKVDDKGKGSWVKGGSDISKYDKTPKPKPTPTGSGRPEYGEAEMKRDQEAAKARAQSQRDGGSTPTPTPKPSPSPSPAPKPSPSPSTPKPSPAPQTGNKAKDMASWAKANPTLAAKSKKKSFNPLMQRTFGYQTGGAPDQKMKKEDFEIQEGIRDKDPEKGTAERKGRLEKKRGHKVDDHPEYLETNMKKRQENNEKARKEMADQKDDTVPRWMKDDFNLYDVVLTYLDENNLIESVEHAEKIMMELTSEQIKYIIDEILGEADMSAANLNSPAHKDRSNEGLSDRQVRMKQFGDKRAQMLIRKGKV